MYCTTAMRKLCPLDASSTYRTRTRMCWLVRADRTFVLNGTAASLHPYPHHQHARRSGKRTSGPLRTRSLRPQPPFSCSGAHPPQPLLRRVRTRAARILRSHFFAVCGRVRRAVLSARVINHHEHRSAASCHVGARRGARSATSASPHLVSRGARALERSRAALSAVGCGRRRRLLRAIPTRLSPAVAVRVQRTRRRSHDEPCGCCRRPQRRASASVRDA